MHVEGNVWIRDLESLQGWPAVRLDMEGASHAPSNNPSLGGSTVGYKASTCNISPGPVHVRGDGQDVERKAIFSCTAGKKIPVDVFISESDLMCWCLIWNDVSMAKSQLMCPFPNPK